MRCSAVKFSARAFPPLLPPSLPSATAAGFLPRLDDSGRLSSTWPVRISPISLPNWTGSRGRFRRVAVMCGIWHIRRRRSKTGFGAWIFKLYHYRSLTSRHVVGRIGRPVHIVENDPPEAGLTEVERDAWKAEAVIIDPTSHPDGQKAAVEEKVGNPTSVFKSLARSINESGREPYLIEANPIVDPSTFWEFESENRGQITSISFDLFPPNMFGLRVCLRTS